MSASVVAKGGSPNVTDVNDFVRVIFDNFTSPERAHLMALQAINASLAQENATESGNTSKTQPDGLASKGENITAKDEKAEIEVPPKPPHLAVKNCFVPSKLEVKILFTRCENSSDFSKNIVLICVLSAH